MNTVELSNVCYEHIKDTFYYGIFGNFKLVIDKNTGCFNATKLCECGGKEFKFWKRLEKSKKMVEYYQTNWGDDRHPNFYEIKGANKNCVDKQITGTYVPKEFILEIASWLSVEFYDKCNNIIRKHREEFKPAVGQWISDLRYGPNSGLVDIFTFVTKFGLAFDISSEWFQDLWYPLNHNQPPPGGGLVVVGNRPIIITHNLLEWMGYKGRDVSDKQERFTRLLESLNISYDEIDHKHALAIEYPCVQKEIQTISKNNIEKKKWICMNPRTFKKVILRLNTENAELVRDYYLNLEEAMFAYGEYTAGYLIKKAESARISRERELVDAISKLDQAEQRASRAERKAIRVHKFMNRITIKEHKLEWIYIGTTYIYAQERIFKIGSTSRLSSRIPQYNTGRPTSDRFYYAWAIKCYNSKDVDYHIQKLLSDFKYRDRKKASEEQIKDNRAEMYHGIKFTDLKDILTFIVNNYDQSVEYINNFIRFRLDKSLEEEDEIPTPLDYKRLTVQIGEHTETIDLDSDEETLRVEFENIIDGLKEQNARKGKSDSDGGVVVIDRKELMSKLAPLTNDTRKCIWEKVKEFSGWTSSKKEIEEGSFKYKIKY